MTSKKGIYLFALLGLLLGIILDQLIRHQNLTLVYYAIPALLSLLFALAYDDNNIVRLAGTSLLLALFLSSPLLPLNVDFNVTNYAHFFTFLVAFPFFVYVVHCFHYAYHHDNSIQISYSTLFAAVWNTIPLIVIATIFSSLANLLIMLAAFIFKTVGSNFLADLYFYNHHFNLICNTTLFFIGLAVGQQNIKIVYGLRFLMLRIMYFLFPFLAIISGIYFVLYLLHSFTGGIEHINPLLVLLPLTVMGVLFFNAYYQDGNEESDYPAWLETVLQVYRVTLFILALMMTYKILREFTIDINVCLYLLVALLFTLTYAVTAFFSDAEERKWIATGNIATGFIFVTLLYLFNLPYMSVDLTIGGKNNPGILTSSITSLMQHPVHTANP